MTKYRRRKCYCCKRWAAFWPLGKLYSQKNGVVIRLRCSDCRVHCVPNAACRVEVLT